MSQTNTVRILPWCISTATNTGAVPLHYMKEALANDMQQKTDVPVTATTPESMDSQASASISSPVHQARTPPLLFLPIPDIPTASTPQSGAHS